MSEHVLVVAGGRDLPARVRAARPGNRTSAICRLEFLGKLRQVTEYSRVIAVRRDAPDDEWVALAAAAHAVDPFTRIATFGETDQDRCAAIGAALGLATHSPRTVALVHDKAAMRTALRAAGVDPTPAAAVADLAALRAFVAEHGLPCIVKPVDGAGSTGVATVTDVAELPAALARAAGAGGGVLVERFHEGPQFSVEAFSEAGKHQVVAVTRKFSDPRTLVELGHVTPAGLDAADRDRIDSLVERTLDVLGVEFGATHTEVVLTAAGPRIIETHVRMGGDEIPALALDATGVDLADHVVRQTVGEEVLPQLRTTLAGAPAGRASAIWFAAAPAAGVLTAVEGADRAAEVPGVTRVELLVRPGAEVAALASSDDRIACARAVADDPDAAVAAARRAVELLEFQIRVRAAAGPTI